MTDPDTFTALKEVRELLKTPGELAGRAKAQAIELIDQMLEDEAPDVRKTFEQMVGELNERRKMIGRVYVHRTTREHYHLIDLAFDERTNSLRAHYARVVNTRIKFSCLLAEFVDSFELHRPELREEV